MAYFSQEDLDRLAVGKVDSLLIFARSLSRATTRPSAAKEYAQHGVSRRLATLVRAVDNVFELLPPENEEIPERDVVVDATISIQSLLGGSIASQPFDGLSICRARVSL
jgi:hypothetical protein